MNMPDFADFRNRRKPVSRTFRIREQHISRKPFSHCIFSAKSEFRCNQKVCGSSIRIDVNYLFFLERQRQTHVSNITRALPNLQTRWNLALTEPWQMRWHPIDPVLCHEKRHSPGGSAQLSSSGDTVWKTRRDRVWAKHFPVIIPAILIRLVFTFLYFIFNFDGS